VIAIEPHRSYVHSLRCSWTFVIRPTVRAVVFRYRLSACPTMRATLPIKTTDGISRLAMCLCLSVCLSVSLSLSLCVCVRARARVCGVRQKPCSTHYAAHRITQVDCYTRCFIKRTAFCFFIICSNYEQFT